MRITTQKLPLIIIIKFSEEKCCSFTFSREVWFSLRIVRFRDGLCKLSPFLALENRLGVALHPIVGPWMDIVSFGRFQDFLLIISKLLSSLLVNGDSDHA